MASLETSLQDGGKKIRKSFGGAGMDWLGRELSDSKKALEVHLGPVSRAAVTHSQPHFHFMSLYRKQVWSAGGFKRMTSRALNLQTHWTHVSVAEEQEASFRGSWVGSFGVKQQRLGGQNPRQLPGETLDFTSDKGVVVQYDNPPPGASADARQPLIGRFLQQTQNAALNSFQMRGNFGKFSMRTHAATLLRRHGTHNTLNQSTARTVPGAIEGG